MSCEHLTFKCNVDVFRLTRVAGGPVTHYSADVKIACGDCGIPFVFQGCMVGSSAYAPTASFDGQEARLPIMPPGLSVPSGLPGYAVKVPEKGVMQ